LFASIFQYHYNVFLSCYSSLFRSWGYNSECELTKRKEPAVDMPYHEVYKSVSDPSWLRGYAQKYGIKAAAREYGCSKNTIKKWIKDEAGTYKNKSRRPHNSPNKTSEELENKIIECRGLEEMGATNLKHQYDIGVAAITVYRVLKRNNK